MIRGALDYQNRENYYIQSNNALEMYLKKYGVQNSAVTCGPSAAINCMAAMGIDVEIETPGGYHPQPEDILTAWFHDPRNWQRLRAIRGATDPEATQYSPHEVPQYYPSAVRSVYGVDAHFEFLHDFDRVADYLFKGWAVQITQKDPGHFIAVVAYDSDLDELIFNDPFPVHFTNHNGFNRRIGRGEYDSTVKPYAIVYKGVM